MKIISFIERHQSDVIEKILRHCNLWKEELPRPPPPEKVELKPDDPKLDYGFFVTPFTNVRYLCFALAIVVFCIVSKPASDFIFSVNLRYSAIVRVCIILLF
jgi:hypothetical protein